MGKQDDISPPEKTCTDCRRKGHLKQDCWGKCAWCGKFGHKTDLCRNKVTDPQKPTTKKAQDKKNKKKEKGKKKVKTHAKKIQQYQQRIEDLRNELPESSDDEVDTWEESSGPDDEPTSRVRKVQSAKESRRESRVLAYAENITDDEVIESIKSAKIKKVRHNSGSSHVNAIISKDSDFRREKSEILLLDTGAGVNLAGEDIIKDSGIKIYELQSERKVTEASVTILDIIGVCEMYIKLNCLKRRKS